MLDIFVLARKTASKHHCEIFYHHVRFVQLFELVRRLLLRRRGLRKARNGDEETKAFLLSPPNLDSGEDFVVDSAETAKKSSSSFSSSIQNTFSSASSLVKAFSISTSFFLFQTENAFAASADAEELKQFLIGFWNFRTGDVTSILLYTVAPIALPYLIFSQVICSFDVFLSLRRSRFVCMLSSF